MTDKANLIERIKISLENVRDCPWLPDLTNDLAKCGWRRLYEETGLSPSNYGTSRVITKTVWSPCKVVSHLSSVFAIEVLDPRVARTYEDAGIEFYTPREIIETHLVKYLEDAISIIKSVPTLYATVTTLVKSIHLIKSEDNNYDVSFSEPHIPFSIFVSVPHPQGSTTLLRIAEAIVHEAMHLQLTLIEASVFLVTKTRKQIFSPWRGQHRSIRGVLHAVYVFRAIDEFLNCLLSIQSYPAEMLKHIRTRQSEIDNQMNTIRPFQGFSELTVIGSCFARKLLQD